MKKKWFYLFITNFLTVFSDNLLKNSLIFLGIIWYLPPFNYSQLVASASAALILPYIFLSPYSGVLSVRYSRLRVMQLFKLLEIPIMCLATVGFAMRSVWIVLLALFLTGIKSCLFSPSKYGLIRDIGGEKKAAFGSGVFEMMAFLGILLGTVGAAAILEFVIVDLDCVVIFGFIFIAIALLGYISSKRLKVEEEVQYTKVETTSNPWMFFKESILLGRKHGLNAFVFGAALLWFVGGMLQMNLVIYCTKILRIGIFQTGVLMSTAAIGIALGCLVTGKLLKPDKHFLWIFSGLGLVALGLTTIILMPPMVLPTAFVVFGIAFAGGMFQVPCLAKIQQADLSGQTGQMFAYVNFVTFALMLIGSGIFYITMTLTDGNSYAVFAVLLLAVLLSFLYFYIERKQMQ